MAGARVGYRERECYRGGHFGAGHGRPLGRGEQRGRGLHRPEGPHSLGQRVQGR